MKSITTLYDRYIFHRQSNSLPLYHSIYRHITSLHKQIICSNHSCNSSHRSRECNPHSNTRPKAPLIRVFIWLHLSPQSSITPRQQATKNVSIFSNTNSPLHFVSYAVKWKSDFQTTFLSAMQSSFPSLNQRELSSASNILICKVVFRIASRQVSRQQRY